MTCTDVPSCGYSLGLKYNYVLKTNTPAESQYFIKLDVITFLSFGIVLSLLTYVSLVPTKKAWIFLYKQTTKKQ